MIFQILELNYPIFVSTYGGLINSNDLWVVLNSLETCRTNHKAKQNWSLWFLNSAIWSLSLKVAKVVCLLVPLFISGQLKIQDGRDEECLEVLISRGGFVLTLSKIEGSSLKLKIPASSEVAPGQRYWQRSLVTRQQKILHYCIKMPSSKFRVWLNPLKYELESKLEINIHYFSYKIGSCYNSLMVTYCVWWIAICKLRINMWITLKTLCVYLLNLAYKIIENINNYIVLSAILTPSCVMWWVKH